MNATASRVGSEGKSFAHAIGIVVVDKLLIGLVIVIAGMFVTAKLDRWRSELAFSVEVAKRRVEKLDLVWAAIDEYLVEQQSLLNDVKVLTDAYVNTTTDAGLAEAGRLRREMQPSMRARSEALVAHHDKLQRTIDRNAIWLERGLLEAIEAAVRASTSAALDNALINPERFADPTQRAVIAKSLKDASQNALAARTRLSELARRLTIESGDN